MGMKFGDLGERNMLENEAKEMQAPLRRIVKTSKLMKGILKIGMVLFGIVLVASIILVAAKFLALLPVDGFEIDISALIPFVVYGIATLVLLKIMHDVFADIAKGESPFARVQVKRFRWAALILLIGAIVEAIFSSSAMSVVQYDDMNITYHDSSVPGNALRLNAGSLLGAALLFTISFVFEYGALLQEFTDDTL